MKGISPVIATVLLIAFAVGTAALVSIWLPNLIGQTTGTTEKQSDRLSSCNVVGIEVEKVTSSSIVYLNPSDNIITNITVFDDNGRNLTVGNASLAGSQLASVSWNRSQNMSVLITGICENSIVVRGECENGQECWE